MIEEQIKGQMSIFDLDIWSGKMSPEPSVPTKAKTSAPSLKKQRVSQIRTPLFLDLRGGVGHQAAASWEMGGLLLGAYTMHSFGECPSEERESRLSQILEERPHLKYCLSAKACQGILRRADRRGKELPTQLRIALERQSVSLNEQVVMGGVKESLSSESGQAPCQHSTISQFSKCLNPWEVQSKRIQPENGIADALYSGEKTWGGGQSYVAQGIDGDIARTLTSRQDGSICPDKGPDLVYCLQGNGIDRADTAGCNGKGWREDESYTLNTIDRPAVAYSFDSVASNSMKSSNPHSGCREVDVSKTLDCANPDPSKNQGGVAIVCGVDVYNQTTTGDKSHPLRSAAADADHVPCVYREPIPINTMVGTRTTEEKRTTMGIGNPGDPQFTISAAHSHAIVCSQDAYDKYEQTEAGASLKASGGNYGGGTENIVIQ